MIENLPSISLLIGAGFSAPMGYPTGAKLNELLKNCDGHEFGFSDDGRLMINRDGTKPNIGYKTSYDYEFDFCVELIQYYSSISGEFDYEKFYDFIVGVAIDDSNVLEIAKTYNKYGYDNNQLIYRIPNIYVQLISYYLVDKNGEKWYDDKPYRLGTYLEGYTGFQNCLKVWLQNSIVHVHSLNHDLFFERLNYTDSIAGELCDGFQELGSPYFGQLNTDGHVNKVRLKRFTNVYRKKCRLIKLHGSRDNCIYYSMNQSMGQPQNYLKIQYGMSFSDLYKEIADENGDLKYEHCWVNYHADFLTGTSSKIERYNEPLLYKILFDRFKDNLNSAEKLIIIGYGGKDELINQYLINEFDHKNKPVFIVDPFPGPAVIELRGKLSAKLISAFLEELKLADLS